MTRKKILYALAAVVVLGLLAAYHLAFRPVSVRLLTPERHVSSQVFGLGTIEARVLSKVGFKVSGILTELKADHGDLVKAGQTLALLDASEQKNRLAKAKASQEKAKANLQLAQANIQKARTNLALKQENSRRRQALLARGVLAKESADESLAAAHNAGAELAQAEAEFTAASAALRDADAQIGLDKVLLGQHILQAPYDAVIIGRHKELGSVLSSGDAVFTLADPLTVWARAFVDEAKAGHLAVGQPAEVRVRSLPRQYFAGQVARIDLESDRVGEERRVYVTWERPRQEFHLGEQAEVVIDTGWLENVLLVPQALVQGYDGSSGQVWTLEESRLLLRRVSLGQATMEGLLPIMEGLPAGAQVLAVLPGGLREGRRAQAQSEALP